jgi:RNA polymerase sigma-70 factor (ECF subfamily)
MTTSGSTTAWDPQVDLAWLVALARRLAQPGDDPDDLAQETWLVAMQAADRPTGSPRAWLAGVLRNLRRMRARNRRRRTERERDVVPPDSTTPEEAMAQLETLDALHHALAALDPVDRRLVLGRYATGQSAVQLGEQFELPASTVRSRLMRARERLREDVQSVRGLACFAPWALRPQDAAIGATVAGGIGGIAMSTATKIIVGVAATALLAVGAGRLVAAPQDSSRVATDTATASTPASSRQIASERAEAQRVKRADEGLDLANVRVDH